MVIPAKGHSTRLKNKNLIRVEGKTLVEIACEKALKCKNIDDVYLDTESDVILSSVEWLRNEGLKVIKRPVELASNDTGANELLIYALHAIDECDLLVQTFATSPMIKASTIDRCIESFVNCNGNHESFFSVLPTQEYFWGETGQPVNFDTKELPNSFQLEKMMMETHGIYGIYAQSLLKYKTRVSPNPLLIPIPKIESLDINDKEDASILQKLFSKEVYE